MSAAFSSLFRRRGPARPGRPPHGPAHAHGGAGGSGGPGSGAPGSRAETRRPAALAELCSDLFSIVITLRSGRDLGESTEVRQRIVRLLEKMDKDARQAGYSSSLVESANFALIALLDEAIIMSQWRGRAAWLATPLQRELLKINVAGEEFFTRLEKLRQNVAENGPALEVFYDCMALGFEGRYRLLGREKLEVLLADLSREIAGANRWNVEDLSPSWRRPDDFAEVVGDGVPVWGTLLVFVPGVILLILLFAAVGRGAAGKTAADVQQFLTNVGR